MTTTEGPTTFRYIGITDESTVCDNCGKVELKATIVIMPLDEGGADEGEVVYYGSTCAARALGIQGGGAKVRKAASGAMVRTLLAADDALDWLTRKNLTRDGQPNELAVKLGMADDLLASLDGEILTAKVAAVRAADALGVSDPKAWLKTQGIG